MPCCGFFKRRILPITSNSYVMFFHQYDSGGPLSCDVTGRGDWVVAGITSWGVLDLSCVGATSMYVGTEPWLDWIKENVPGLPGYKDD